MHVSIIFVDTPFQRRVCNVYTDAKHHYLKKCNSNVPLRMFGKLLHTITKACIYPCN